MEIQVRIIKYALGHINCEPSRGGCGLGMQIWVVTEAMDMGKIALGEYVGKEHRPEH